MLLMEERAMYPAQLEGEPQVLVTQFDAESTNASLALAYELRAAGLRTDLYPEPDRYGRQFKYGEERRIRYALLLSPREIEAGVVAIKDLVSGEQVEVKRGDVVAAMQARLRG